MAMVNWISQASIERTMPGTMMWMSRRIFTKANDIRALLRILPHNVIHLLLSPDSKIFTIGIFAVDQCTHLSRCIVTSRSPDGKYFEARRRGSQIGSIVCILMRNIRPVFKVPARNIPELGIVGNMGQFQKDTSP